MEATRRALSRRQLLLALAGTTVCGSAGAFGQEGAFHPRILLTGGLSWGGSRESAPGRWAWEMVRRTSAPGRLVTKTVRADDTALLTEPFVVWSGDSTIPRLSEPEIRSLRQFIRLGGVLLVDDADPLGHAFGDAARRELRRVLPRAPIVKLPKSHVIYKSFYLVDRPVGRVEGPATLEAMLPSRPAQVLFSSHDLLGALARNRAGAWALDVEPGGALQRERALRMAVNLGMYVLCSDYKDDQVHAAEIMRRRGSGR